MLPDFERPDRIGEFYRNPKTRTFAELGALRARAARRAGALVKGKTATTRDRGSST
jgi:hypothetical protein